MQRCQDTIIVYDVDTARQKELRDYLSLSMYFIAKCIVFRYILHHFQNLGCLCVDAQKIENIILNFVQILTRKDLPLHTIRTEAPIDIDEAIDKEYGMPSLHQRSQGYTHV